MDIDRHSQAIREPAPPASLLACLATLKPIAEDLGSIDDP